MNKRIHNSNLMSQVIANDLFNPAFAAVYQKRQKTLQKLKFKLAINKTVIGKISRSFEFLGDCFNHHRLIGKMRKTIQTIMNMLLAKCE